MWAKLLKWTEHQINNPKYACNPKVKSRLRWKNCKVFKVEWKFPLSLICWLFCKIALTSWMCGNSVNCQRELHERTFHFVVTFVWDKCWWVFMSWISLLPPFRVHQAHLQCDPHDAIYSNDPALFQHDQTEISEDVYIMPDAWTPDIACCPVLILKM